MKRSDSSILRSIGLLHPDTPQASLSSYRVWIWELFQLELLLLMVDHAFSQSNFLPFCPLTSWALPKTRLWGAGILNLVLLLASEVSQDMASAWNDVIGAFIFRMVQDWLRGEQRRHCSLEAAEGWASYHRQYFGEIDYSTGFAGSRTVHNLDCKWVLSIDSSLVGNDSWDSSKDSFCLECSETLRSPMTCSLILRSSFEDCLARAFRTN